MTQSPAGESLLVASNISVVFDDATPTLRRLRGGEKGFKAVDNVSLTVAPSEIMGLVGESGAGKTTLAKTILRLLEPSAGTLTFVGKDITHARGVQLLEMRRRMQMVFQEAHGSLSPRLSVSEAIQEPFRIHRIPSSDRRPVRDLLEAVELPGDLTNRYPHEISGGQARRVGLARALALEPELVIADEPTSGLDVSAAASVLNLLRDLRDRLGVAYLIVTHDLSIVSYLADRVAVMYLGEIVEQGPTAEVLDEPVHPYSMLLSASRPHIGGKRLGNGVSAEFTVDVIGEMPSARNPPKGCRFHTRCPFATEICSSEAPEPEVVAMGHTVACHHWRDI